MLVKVFLLNQYLKTISLNSQKITFKQSTNIKQHTSFNNNEFCCLILWKLASIFNDCLKASKFPHLMKIAETSPLFKNLDNTSKGILRPISTLSNFTKLFESIRFTQRERCMQNKFSKYLAGFGKNHNTENSLSRIIHSWKVRINHGSKVGVIIMDLSKAFDSLNHWLLLAKFKAYNLDSNLVTFMKSYFTKRSQRCKINSSFSEWGKVLNDVTQRSI